jgi:hypothetical protein
MEAEDNLSFALNTFLTALATKYHPHAFLFKVTPTTAQIVTVGLLSSLLGVVPRKLESLDLDVQAREPPLVLRLSHLVRVCTVIG